MSDHLSQSTCLEMLHPKTDERVNPSVEVYHLVGKLSMAETLITDMQRKFCNVYNVCNYCNQGKTLCSPCVFIVYFHSAVNRLHVPFLRHNRICLKHDSNITVRLIPLIHGV